MMYDDAAEHTHHTQHGSTPHIPAHSGLNKKVKLLLTATNQLSSDISQPTSEE